MLAITSICIAAKFEEVKLPKISDYVLVCENLFSEEQIRDAEVSVLQYLDWSINFTTVVEFLHFFLCQGVVYSSDSMVSTKRLNPGKVGEQMQKYAEFFADLCLQEFSFYQYSSLIIASAIICASRFQVGIIDSWPS